MNDFDLNDLDLEGAEQRAKEVADRPPEVAEGEDDCEGCKI